MQQAKIAVAGATGRLGRHVIEVLDAWYPRRRR
jgi:dihydrodipicolinate reductase